jgi:Tfp pilus assembly protein PilO
MDHAAIAEKYMKAARITLATAGGLALVFVVTVAFFIGPMPGKIRAYHKEIEKLQEKLISSQITARQMEHVSDLIQKNLAFSTQDTLAQGASLSFLKDLTKVLDKLKINLVSLEPLSPVDQGGYIETPYRLEIVCNYNQLCQLVNKMEKSPRFISVKALKVENYFDDYFAQDKPTMDQCNASMEVHTLTLIKGKNR